MPSSLNLFAVTAMVFVLQLIPGVGIALMFFGASYWSVLLINAGFIGIAAEALWGRADKRWLALPMIWFGGYLLVAGYSHFAADQLNRQFVQANARKSIPFSDHDSSIVLDHPETLGYGVDATEVARQLVLDYPVERVYVRNSHVGAEHVAYKRRPDGCDPAIVETPPASCGFRRGPYRFTDQSPERPWRPTVLVYLGAVTGSHDQHKLVVPIHVSKASGENVDLIAGAIEPLSWWPQPILGCGLNDQAGKWQCMGLFGRAKWRGLGAAYVNGPAAAGVIAQALKL